MKDLQPCELDATEGRLVDVRSLDEFAARRLARAECVPLDRLVAEAGQWDREAPLILMCKGGIRSRQGAEQLVSLGFSNVMSLEGGIDACRKAGLPVIEDRKKIPIFRQVMITAGLMLLVSLALALVNPYFLIATAFVASGLVFAGITGICPMAYVLERMPWNRIDSTKPTQVACCAKG